MNDLPGPVSSGARPLWSRAWVQFLLTGLVVATIMFWRLADAPLDEHEARAAMAAQRMYQPDGKWILMPPMGSEATPESIARPLPPYTQWNRWLIPVNNGKPRLEKTPLAYWTMVALAGIRGQFDSWVARLTSAISALLTVWVVLALGRRMFGPRAGLLGALMLATAFGFEKWGRNARPEMLLCLMCTVAMGCFYLGLEASSRARRVGWMCAFWVALGLANLSKQFLPMLLGLPLVVYLCWRQTQSSEALTASGRWAIRATGWLGLVAMKAVEEVPIKPLRQWARRSASRLANWKGSPGSLTPIYVAAGLAAMVLTSVLMSLSKSEMLNFAVMGALLIVPLAWYVLATRGYKQIIPLLPTAIPGMAVALAMFLPWIIYMVGLFGDAAHIFNEQVAERATGSGALRGSGAEYYLGPIVTMTLPWVMFLPGGFAAAFMKRFAEHRRALMFLMLWAVLLIGLLTLASGKREHYILPMVPAMCLLMGFVAEDVFFRHRWISQRLAQGIGSGYALAGIAGPGIVGLVSLVFLSADLNSSQGDPVKFQHLAPEDTRKFAQFAWVLALAAALSVPMLILFLRRRFAWGFGLLIVCMVTIYLGYQAHAGLWNERDEVSDFATQAAVLTGPEAPVLSWPIAQIRTVHAYGRNMPDASWTRRRLAWEYGDENASRRFEAFMKDPRKVAWVFTYDDFDECRDLERMGFVRALSLQTIDKRVVFDFKSKQLLNKEKLLTFLLMRNPSVPPPQSAPATESCEPSVSRRQ